jgi:hypothetical protein
MRLTQYVATNRNTLRSRKAKERYERIMRSIQAGNRTPAQLEKDLGEPARRIGAALYRMKRRGMVRLIYEWEVCLLSCEKKNTEHEE